MNFSNNKKFSLHCWGVLFLAGLVFYGMLISFTLSGCSREKEEAGVEEWQYEQTITEPVTVQAASQDITLGDLSAHGVSIHIPGDAFDTETQVTISHPEGTLQINTDAFTPLGVPLEVQTEGQRRLNKPVTITIKMDIGEIEEAGSIFAVYFNGINNWDYIVPDEVNIAEGTMTFTTYHFSTYAAGRLTEDKRVKEFVHRKSVEEWVGRNIESEVEEARDEIIREILEGHMGITDETVFSIVAKAVADEYPVGKLSTAFLDGDAAKFTQTVATSAGKYIANTVDSGSLTGILGTISEKSWMVGTAAKTAGALAEGDLVEATKHIVDGIASEFLVVKVGKVWVKIVDHKINVWKSEEVEKAYQVFKEGAESRIPFWGYNVEPENFDDLWDQMKGVATKITSDAIESYSNARGISPDDISFDEQNKIREAARERLKAQFEQRLAQEDEIEKIKENNMTMIELLREKGLLDISFSNPMYDGREGEDLEMLLMRSFRIIEKVMRDTGRSEIVDRTDFDIADPHERDNLIPRQWLADLIWIYYNDGEEAYQERLIEMGLVDPFTGIWQGVMVIHELQMDTKPMPNRRDEIIRIARLMFSEIFVMEAPKAGSDEIFDDWARRILQSAVGQEISMTLEIMAGIDDPGGASNMPYSVYILKNGQRDRRFNGWIDNKTGEFQVSAGVLPFEVTIMLRPDGSNKLTGRVSAIGLESQGAQGFQLSGESRFER